MTVTGPARFQTAPPEPQPHRWRAAAAVLALVALVVGVPVALVTLTGAPPIPHSLPTLDAIGRQLGAAQLVTVLLAVVWLAWLQFAYCTVVEIAAAVRGGVLARPVPFAGPSQRLARTLVALVLVSAALAPAASAAVAGARPATTVVSLESTARLSGAGLGLGTTVDAGRDGVRPGAGHRAFDPSGTAPRGIGLPAATGRAGSAWSPGARPVTLEELSYGGFHPGDISELAGRKVYVVEPPVGRHHDSLWEIAQRHLGDGRRYAEIYQLNVGRVQPDGRALQLSRLIQPGWYLVMPEDAAGVERVPARSVPTPAPTPTPAPPSTVTPSPAASAPAVSAPAAATHVAPTPTVAPHTVPPIVAPPTVAPTVAPTMPPHTVAPHTVPPTVAPTVAPSTVAAQPLPVEASTAGSSFSPTAPPTVPPTASASSAPASPAALPVESPLEPPQPSTTATPATPAPTHPSPVAATAAAGSPSTHPAPATPPAAPTPATHVTEAPPTTVTTPAASMTQPPQTTAPGPFGEIGASSDPVDQLPHIPSPAQASNNLAAGFGASGLLAAGLLIAVQRRRERERHRPRERTGSLIDAEVWLRVGADVQRSQLLDCALRTLADSCARAGIDVPEIPVVTVDGEDVELRLSAPRHDAPAPWTSLDDGARWTLRRGHVPRGRIGAEAALPRLVSIGRDLADRDVLIDLAAAGGPVCVHGDPLTAEHVVRALAVELVTNPWSGGMHVTAVDLPATLGVVACLLDVPQDPADPLAELRGRFAAHPVGQRPLEQVVLGRPPARDVADGLRLLGADGDLGVLVAGPLPGARWRLQVDEMGNLTCHELGLRVSANRLDDATLETLAVLFTDAEPLRATAPAQGRAGGQAATGSVIDRAGGTSPSLASASAASAPTASGSAASAGGLVSRFSGPTPGSGFTGLGSRRGPIIPPGLPLPPGKAGKSGKGGAGVTRPRSAPPLIASSGIRVPGHSAAPVSRPSSDPDALSLVVTDEPDRLAGVRVPAPPVPVDDSAWAAAAARVGVIGPVAVRAPRTIDSQRTDHAAEVVAYLALHPDGVHPTVLSAALWPRGVTPDVRTAMFDRVREWLGLDEHGNPRLLLGSDGRLRLALDVVLDWDVVCTLLTAAQQTRGRRGERELLARALQLVRGPVAGGPLAAQRRGGYAWLARTDLEQTVPAVISAAALRLSALSRSSDPASAARALRCALGADPGDQGLWRELLRCEQQQQFGREAVLQATAAMRAVLTDLDVDLEPETLALVSSLIG